MTKGVGRWFFCYGKNNENSCKMIRFYHFIYNIGGILGGTEFFCYIEDSHSIIPKYLLRLE